MTDSWRLAELENVAGVRGAVVATSDGFVKAESPRLGDETSERLAAAASTLASLARGMNAGLGDHEFGPLREMALRYEGGCLFLREAGELSVLIVVTDEKVRPDLVALEMQTQITRQIGGLSATARGV